MPLLTLSGACLHHCLLVLVPGGLGALVALALADDSVTPLAPGHVSRLRRRGLLGRLADRVSVDQVLGAAQASHPAPETVALNTGGGPGCYTRRRRLLVLVVDGHQLPLGILFPGFLISLVNEAKDTVTTSTDC